MPDNTCIYFIYALDTNKVPNVYIPSIVVNRENSCLVFDGTKLSFSELFS